MSPSSSEEIQSESPSPADEQAAGSLFRQPALDDQYRGIERLGRRLQVSSRWQLWPFRLLMAVLLGGLAFAFFGRWYDYASGPAMVRVGEAAGPCQPRDDVATAVLLLPAHHRPDLRPGMALRLRLTGFPSAATTTKIEAVGDAIIGPRSARQLLGERLAGSLELSGALVPVCARLVDNSFDSGGRQIGYADGMTGRGEVRMSSQRLIFALLPGLAASPQPASASGDSDG